MNAQRLTSGTGNRRPFGPLEALARDLSRNRTVYLLALPMVLYYLLFHYQPMYGAQIAFKNFSPGLGIWGSSWAGLQHFEAFFRSYYAWRIIRNTLVLNFYQVVWGFPAPIILALLLNEIAGERFKRTVQTVTYLPHFISMVVVCGMILDFFARDGVVNQIITAFGGKATPFMIQPQWFATIYVGSNIWQELGWGSIVYLAALSAINPELYEAARVDGANRWRQTWSVTIPCIAPTIVIMLILRMGRIMSIGAEKILLLYNPNTYEAADVISTFVYRKGLLEMSYSYSTAVNLFNSAINFLMLVWVNRLSRRMTETSLW